MRGFRSFFVSGVFDMLRARIVPDGMSVSEVNAYINYMTKQHADVKHGTVDIIIDGDGVTLTLTPDPVRVERVRRISRNT